jgi:phosphate-selective porin OprO/OprP
MIRLLVSAFLSALGPERATPPLPPPAPIVETRPAWELGREPGQGVKAVSPDGSFQLQIWLRGQLRYTMSRTVDRGMVDTSQVFQLRRGAVFFGGHAFGVHNKYFVQAVFAPQDLGLENGQITQSPIFDWFFTFDYLRDLSLRVGQYKPFYSRQFIDAWGDLQFVDRSVVQNEFHLERDVGFDLFSNDLAGKGGMLQYSLGLYFGQGRTSFQPRPFAMTYLARLELRPLGDFDAYREVDLERNPSPKLAIGAAYAYQDRAAHERGVSGAVPPDGGTTSLHDAVLDAIFKWRGLSISAEAFMRDGLRHPGDAVDEMGMPIPPTHSRSGWGWFLQAGWLVPKIPLEVAARGGELLGFPRTSLPDGGEIGGGLGWYIHGHAMKLQLDWFRTWSGVPLLHGDDQLRLQLQLAM